MLKVKAEQIAKLQTFVDQGHADSLEEALELAIVNLEELSDEEPELSDAELAELERRMDESDRGIGVVRYASKEAFVEDIVAGGKALLANLERVST